MLEYASIRFVFVCASATTFPPVIVTAASIARTARPDQHAEDRGKGGGLRSDRHERGRRCGRAVVRVGRPLVEGDDRRFEAEADRDERERDDGRSVRDPLRREDVGDGGEVGRLRDAIEPNESVQEKGGAEGAEEEVF